MQNRKSILDPFKYFFTFSFIYFKILIKARVIESEWVFSRRNFFRIFSADNKELSKYLKLETEHLKHTRIGSLNERITCLRQV